jgi:cytoskeletal protein CcmA (bactofilin family)
MMNFNRRDRPAETLDPRNPAKQALRPAVYEPPGASAPSHPSHAVQPLPPDPSSPRDRPTGQPAVPRPDIATTGHPRVDNAAHVGGPRADSMHTGTARTDSAHAGVHRPDISHAAAHGAAGAPEDAPGSRLFVGVNVKLKGVEISDCDLLVVEGRVEATVHSKAMEIAKPGTLQGTVEVDVAEIHGDFTGELTARTRLVVHGTGRVSGTIRYGRLVVADGGTMTGDVKELGAAEASPAPSRRAASEPRAAT